MADDGATATNRAGSASWLLWWKVDGEEIAGQARGYSSLPIWKTSRGIALICLLVSFVITVGMVMLGATDQTAYVDAGLMLGLGLFIRFGHRWAMIAAMVLWTVEKLVQAIGAPMMAAVAVLWWAVYMHAFWMAFKVEQARRHTATPEEAAAEF